MDAFIEEISEDFPAKVCESFYAYETGSAITLHTRNASELEDAPEGYPGKLCTVSKPWLPTLSRMWNQQQAGNWAGYQPPPTAHLPEQQFSQAPPPAMPPAGGPKKRAFICGINYRGTSCTLNGCENDANCIEFMLKSKFGFTDENILMFKETHPDPMRRPTKANMFMGMQWLITGAQPGDSLVFHYSGHGGQKRDMTGEEMDGMNETLCPMDFQRAGEILDDEINMRLVNPLPQGVRLHAIIDACHSGSVLDLPYQAIVNNGVITWNSAYAGQTRAWKGTGGGFAVQFSASSDHETAADTAKLSGGVPTGAATFSFIKAIEQKGGKDITYGDLLLGMWHTLHQAGLGAQSGGGGYGGAPPQTMGGGLDGMLMAILGGVGGGAGFRGQSPTLSSNYAFDLSYKFSL